MGAFFMATDPVTNPVTVRAQVFFGIIIGLLAGLFRIKGASADSVSYAIVITNMLVPFLDKMPIHKPLGYTNTADGEYAPAQYILGLMYYNGEIVSQDYAKAREWFEKAAAQGYAAAQYNLGQCYYCGKGVEQNLQKAAECFYTYKKETKETENMLHNESDPIDLVDNWQNVSNQNSLQAKFVKKYCQKHFEKLIMFLSGNVLEEDDIIQDLKLKASQLQADGIIMVRFEFVEIPAIEAAALHVYGTAIKLQ